MTTKIRVGILGYGLAGRYFHVPFIQESAQFELCAVATSRDYAVQQLPGVRITDVDSIMDADDIDLVVVATPHRLHVSQALAALERGKHVVVEKPVAISVDEIKQLQTASTQANRHVIPFQNRRWDGDFTAVRQLIQSGTLGTIHHFESHWQMFRPQPRGVWRDAPDELGGILNDLGPHLIDQTLQLFGTPQSVFGQVMIHRQDCTVDDAFRIQLQYDSGLYVLLETDVLNGLTVPRFAIRGTNGTFEKYGVDPQESMLREGISPDDPRWATQTETAQIVTGGAHGLTIKGEMSIPAGDYRHYWTAVANAITGSAPPPVTLEEVFTQMRILEAVRQSSTSGQPVQVEA
ncbi:MAG: Gfo/Idh/MocA family oxidoreductase [Aggregatilineales bacterium]